MPDELVELREAVKQTKRTVKGLTGQIRVTTQFLADLEQRLDRALATGRLEPTAEEAQDGSTSRQEFALR